MNDEARKRARLDSPCVNICVVHPDEDLCTGCLRSTDEIARWAKMPPQERERILASLPARAGRLKKRRGGRVTRLQRRGQGALKR